MTVLVRITRGIHEGQTGRVTSVAEGHAALCLTATGATVRLLMAWLVEVDPRPQSAAQFRAARKFQAAMARYDARAQARRATA